MSPETAQGCLHNVIFCTSDLGETRNKQNNDQNPHVSVNQAGAQDYVNPNAHSEVSVAVEETGDFTERDQQATAKRKMMKVRR
jgi:hypothetical protein